MRRVSQLDSLLAQIHCPTAARCQIDRPGRHLSRKTERVSGRRAARYNDFTALQGERFDSLLNGRRTNAEPTGNRMQIDTAPSTHQPATFS